MTVSTHDYTVTLIGSPDRELALTAGTLRLDADRAPHVQGALTLAAPDEETLAALDPRRQARIRIDVAAVTPGGTQDRSFDLGLRDVIIDHVPDEVALNIASDEAILDGYRAFTDIDMYAYAGDLNALCTAVVRTALDDPSIVISGPTADVTPLWDTINLIPNPGAEVDAVGWTAIAGATGLVRTTAYHHTGAAAVQWVGSAESDVSPVAAWNICPATQGAYYSFSIWVAAAAGATGHVIMRFYDSGQGDWGSIHGETVAMTTDWVLLTVSGKSPPHTAFVYPIIRIDGAPGGAIADDATLTADRFVVPSFSGATPDTADYDYSWTGPANNSTSRRAALIPDTADPEALIWKAGQSGLDFLHPLVQVAGLRLVCDERRAWSLRDAEYTAPGSLSIAHAVNMISADQTLSLTTDLWFDAAVTIYTWTNSWGLEEVRVDAFKLVASPVHVARFEKHVAYPGPGFSEYAVRRAQGRGREVSATIVSDWRAHAEQPVAITANGTPKQSGKTASVVFDLSSDEMTVTTRTTEIRAGSIDALLGTIDSLVGTIDSL